MLAWLSFILRQSGKIARRFKNISGYFKDDYAILISLGVQWVWNEISDPWLKAADKRVVRPSDSAMTKTYLKNEKQRFLL